MGTDKAFLDYRGKTFVALITEEMLRVSGDVLVLIGAKEEEKFRAVLDSRVKVARDSLYLTNPLGGMLSSVSLVSNDYAAYLACDAPFVKADVIDYLHRCCTGHDAAVPIWPDRRIEPLCAVYRVQQAQQAGLKAVSSNQPSIRDLVSFLRDVSYVRVDELKRFDPILESLRNVNSMEEYKALKERT